MMSLVWVFEMPRVRKFICEIEVPYQTANREVFGLKQQIGDGV
jgi:hypothetical protein